MNVRYANFLARSAPSLLVASTLVMGCGADPENEKQLVAALGAGSAPTAGSLPPVPPVVAGGSAGAAGSGGAASGGATSPSTAAMTIVSPRHGDALYLSSPWYDQVTETIEVRGGISHLASSFIASGNYTILINGQFSPGTVTPLPQQGKIGFSGRIPAVDDWNWAMRGVLVELIDTLTDEVVARSNVSYFDLRLEPAGSPVADDKQPIPGMYMQLSDFGIGYTGVDPELTGLEGPHLSLLPEPSLATFNEALGLAARNQPRQLDTGAKRELCVNLAEVADDQEELGKTSEFPAYRQAWREAKAQQLAYENAKKNAQACNAIFPLAGFLCQAMLETLCVKSDPDLEDFELCIDEVETEVTDLDVTRVGDVSLQFIQTPPGNESARLQSHVRLDGVDGRANAYLRQLRVRWANRTCALPPQGKLDDKEISDRPWLEDWTTCRNLELEAPTADTSIQNRPEKFEVNRAQTNEELETVRQYEDARFAFSDLDVDVAKDTCALRFVTADVEEKVRELSPLLIAPLDTTWNSGGQRTHQAKALEATLKRLELGASEHEDFKFTANLNGFYSKPLAGMRVGLETLLLATDATTTKRAYPGRLYLPSPSGAPYALDALHNGLEPFDLAYTLTTGYLNQILHIRSATDRLHFDFEPTWEDLAAFGISAAAAGSDPALPPPLDGTVLGLLDTTFKELGRTRLQIHVKPTLDVVFWMAPDPNNPHPVQGAPVGYGVSALDVRFAEPDTVDSSTGDTIPGKEWLRLNLSVADRDFYIGLPTPESNSNSMRVAFVDDDWGASVVSTAFGGCPMVPHGILEPSTSCERTLESTLTALFRARLEPILIDMLSDIPAPSVWDAGGTTDVVRKLRQTQHLMGAQQMTFFADLVD